MDQLSESGVKPDRLTPIWTRPFALMWACRFCFFFSLHMLVPVLPLYLVDGGASPAQVGAVIAVFAIASTLCRPVVGFQIDQRGPRLILNVTLVILAIGQLGYVVAWSLPLLVLFRLVHGVGWSGCTAGAGTAVANMVPRERRAEALGLYNISSDLSFALATPLSLWLYHIVGTRTVFLIGACFVLLSWAAVQLLPAPRDRTERAPSEANPASIFAFFHRDTLAVTVLIMGITFVNGGVQAFLPLLAATSGTGSAATYFSVFAVCMMVVRPLTGRLSDRHGRAALAVPAFLLVIAAMSLLAWIPSPRVFVVCALLHGAGFGTLQAILMATMVDTIVPARRGTAMAQWSMFYDIGLAAGAMVLGAVLSLTNQNYTWMFLTAVLVIGLFLMYYLLWMRKNVQRTA